MEQILLQYHTTRSGANFPWHNTPAGLYVSAFVSHMIHTLISLWAWIQTYWVN